MLCYRDRMWCDGHRCINFMQCDRVPTEMDRGRAKKVGLPFNICQSESLKCFKGVENDNKNLGS